MDALASLTLDQDNYEAWLEVSHWQTVQLEVLPQSVANVDIALVLGLDQFVSVMQSLGIAHPSLSFITSGHRDYTSIDWGDYQVEILLL